MYYEIPLSRPAIAAWAGPRRGNLRRGSRFQAAWPALLLFTPPTFHNGHLAQLTLVSNIRAGRTEPH
ncbi:MAG: hypothetical protein KDF65_14945 [Anaerolineae bacterium]|nr:hypothetical protein [Anaerolineae bacterium]